MPPRRTVRDTGSVRLQTGPDTIRSIFVHRLSWLWALHTLTLPDFFFPAWQLLRLISWRGSCPTAVEELLRDGAALSALSSHLWFPHSNLQNFSNFYFERMPVWFPKQHRLVWPTFSRWVPTRRMETNPIPVVTVQTAPFDDQRPGTNGLRRKTAVFEGRRNYLQNYIQSLLSSIDLRDRQGCTMVVGSDGRYFSRAATEVIVQMAAANGVRTETGGWMSCTSTLGAPLNSCLEVIVNITRGPDPNRTMSLIWAPTLGSPRNPTKGLKRACCNITDNSGHMKYEYFTFFFLSLLLVCSLEKHWKHQIRSGKKSL